MPSLNFSIPNSIQKISVAPNETPVAFTVSNKAEGARAYCRIVADSSPAKLPTFSGLKELADSLGFDNRSGIVNLIEFFCDGDDVWYKISQEKGALPRFRIQPLPIINLSNTRNVQSLGADTYTASIPKSTDFPFFDGLIMFPNPIPAGKAGRITVRCTQTSIIGFATDPTLPIYTDQTVSNRSYCDYRLSSQCKWYAWLGPHDASNPIAYLYTAQGLGTSAASIQSDRGILASNSTPSEIFIRLTKTSAGSILVETAPENPVAANGLPSSSSWQFVARKTMSQSPNLASSFSLARVGKTEPLYVFAALTSKWPRGSGNQMKMKLVSFEIEE